MQEISLNGQVWNVDLDARIGSPGGFGEVFRGLSKDGDAVAVKRLKVNATEAAHRELNMSEILAKGGWKKIVPILDYGQDAQSDSYFVVMPICDGDLQELIDETGKLTLRDSLDILLSILEGISEVSTIVHRDLKPSNILQHEGVWKIADFGIARFVENSTSLETLKNCLTPTYAAPEQWRMQRASQATDIYALGCIAYTLLTGTPPYDGSQEDLREKHLSSVPPQLPDVPPMLSSILTQMLRKPMEVRPRLQRIQKVFNDVIHNLDANAGQQDDHLAVAVAELSEQQAKEDAHSQRLAERRQNRRQLFLDGQKELGAIRDRLFGSITAMAQDVMDSRSSKARLAIGNATFSFDVNGDRGLQETDYDGSHGWGVHRKKSAWDVVGLMNISLEQRLSNQVYTQSASLFLGRQSEEQEFRWFEVAFWSLGQSNTKDEPFATDYVWELDEALSNVMGILQLAYEPIPLDGENEPIFRDYWIGRVAQAMTGKLQRPSRMPMSR